jgi:hypothetical protein
VDIRAQKEKNKLIVITCPFRTVMSFQLFRYNCSLNLLRATDLRMPRVVIHASHKYFWGKEKERLLQFNKTEGGSLLLAPRTTSNKVE